MQGWGDRRGLLAVNYTLYSVLLTIGCNASAVQRVADDLQAVITTGRLVVWHCCLWRILRCLWIKEHLHCIAACMGAGILGRLDPAHKARRAAALLCYVNDWSLRAQGLNCAFILYRSTCNPRSWT